MYIVNSFKELSLLGESDAVRFGIATINLNGASEEVDVKNVEFLAKSELPRQEPVQSDQFQRQIEDTINLIKKSIKMCFQM